MKKWIRINPKLAKWSLAVTVFGYFVLSVTAGIGLIEMSVRLPKRQFLHEHISAATQRIAKLGAHLENIEVTSNDGLKLRGSFVSPRVANGAVVMLLHGVTDNRMGVAGYGEFLVKNGFSVLVPDARTHGVSDGTIATYGLLEAGDVRHWVDWIVRAKKPTCIYALGESTGAAIILQSLAKENRFCAVVAESPFSDFREAIYDRIGERFKTGPWLGRTLLRPLVESGITYALFKYGLDLEKNSPRDALAQSHTPVLLIHGEQDLVLRVRNSEMIHQSNPRTVLWKVAGAGHCGAWSAQPREFESRLLEWFHKPQRG